MFVLLSSLKRETLGAAEPRDAGPAQTLIEGHRLTDRPLSHYSPLFNIALEIDVPAYLSAEEVEEICK